MTPIFDDDTRALLDAKNFATITTLMPDGAPHSAVMWFKRDGDALLFTSLARRQKVRNLRRDSRVNVVVYDLTSPYHSVEVRGRAELSPDPEKALSFELSHRYLGIDPPGEAPGDERVTIRVTPEKITVFKV
ncbi:MAG: PPOX class F420-dependent oxidoreductase [Dehalococcoidia bacterium]